MGGFDMNIPGESAEYRTARAALLQAEANLRAEVENVAALRRALPEGAAPAAAYSFQGVDRKNSALEDLFGGKPSLFIYSFMFEPAAGQGTCPMCCAFLDSFNGAAPHIADRTAIAVIAKASAKDLSELVEDRGWSNLPMYSSAGGSSNTDYNAESADGG